MISHISNNLHYFIDIQLAQYSDIVMTSGCLNVMTYEDNIHDIKLCRYFHDDDIIILDLYDNLNIVCAFCPK